MVTTIYRTLLDFPRMNLILNDAHGVTAGSPAVFWPVQSGHGDGPVAVPEGRN